MTTTSTPRFGVLARLGAAALIAASALTLASAPAAVAAPGPMLAAAAGPAALPYSGAPRLTSLVAFARTWATKGIPYVTGGGHSTYPGMSGGGFDCSGWVRYAYWSSFGVDFGGGTADQLIRSGRFVRTSHPVPGDVLAFNYEGGSHVDHVAIYVGGKAADGRPAMVDAPHTGSTLGVHGFGFGLLGYYHYVGATAADSGPLVRPTSTSISLPATADANQVVSITGHVAGGSPSGVVRLYGRSSSKIGWSRIAEARPNASGNYTLRYRAKGKSVQLFVRYLGTSSSKMSNSVVRTLGVTVRNTATTATSVATADAGQLVEIRGRATGSAETSKRTMRLYTRKPGGAWKTTAQVLTDAHGYYAFRIKGSGATIQYKVRFLGTGHARPSESATRTLAVTVRNTTTTASLSETTANVGEIITVRGRAAGSPETANVTVRLYTRSTTAIGWTTTAQVKTDAHGYYTFTYRVPDRSRVYFMVRFLPRPHARTSDSKSLMITVAG